MIPYHMTCEPHAKLKISYLSHMQEILVVYSTISYFFSSGSQYMTSFGCAHVDLYRYGLISSDLPNNYMYGAFKKNWTMFY